jgi:threonine dehydrogenase-like Zn-dependent dehydrogenase
MISVAVLKPGQISLVDIPEPEPEPYQVRIKTEAACICNATDRKLVDGHFPGIKTYPLLLGHETAGIVDRVGEKVRNYKVGDRVIGGLLLEPTDDRYISGWGGFSEYVIAGDHQAMCADGVADPTHHWYEVYQIMRVVPPEIPLPAAVLLCTWREVYAAFIDFHLVPDQRILIFGAGPVGLSFTRIARLLGFDYIGVVEYSDEKKAKALALGASEVFSPGASQLAKLRQERDLEFDAVIDAVGSQEIINFSLPLIKMAGSICVYGVIDQPVIQVAKETGPYNFNLLMHQWPTRNNESAAQEPLCQWILQNALDYHDFISTQFSIDDITRALELSRTGQAVKILIRF